MFVCGQAINRSTSVSSMLVAMTLSTSYRPVSSRRASASRIRSMSVVTGHRELHVRDFDRKAACSPDLYRPIDRLPEVTILASDVADVPAAERRRKEVRERKGRFSVLTHDHRGDPLADRGQSIRALEDVAVRVRVGIDEARSERQPGVDDERRPGRRFSRPTGNNGLALRGWRSARRSTS